MSHFNDISCLSNNFGSIESTIAAIATPRASGAIAVIRLSGSDAVQITRNLFKPAGKNVSFPTNPRQMTLGFIHNPDLNRILDQVNIAFFPAPNSYTGEDMIEIFCHGGLLVSKEILDLLLSNGASLAQPGEFTLRAYLHGKLDLIQAESILDIVNARNRTFLDSAVSQLCGSLSRSIDSARNSLIDILAQIEVAIEYPDDLTPQLSRDILKNNINDILSILNNIISNSESSLFSNDAPKIVIVGKPNSGKSSLMNRLLGYDRAIVSNIPGTTRDFIGDSFSTSGLDFLVLDTAGITSSSDIIESEGIRRTFDLIKHADITIALFDGSAEWSSDDDFVVDSLKDSSLLIPVVTKSDLQRALDLSIISSRFPHHAPIFCSSLTGEGISPLQNAIASYAESMFLFSSDAIILNTRHKKLIKSAVLSLSNCISNLDSVPDDILTIDIKDAADSLGKIIGKQTSEDVLVSIFSNFCVGK